MSNKRNFDQFAAGIPVAQAAHAIKTHDIPRQSIWSRITNTLSSVLSYVYECLIVDSVHYQDYIAERERKRRRLQPPGAWIDTPRSRRRSPPKHSPGKATPTRRLNFLLDCSPNTVQASPGRPLEESPDIFPATDDTSVRALATLHARSSNTPNQSPDDNAPNYRKLQHEAYFVTQEAKKRRAADFQSSTPTSITSTPQSIGKHPGGSQKQNPETKRSLISSEVAYNRDSGYENDMGDLPDATPAKKAVHWDKDSVLNHRPQNIMVRTFDYDKAINEAESPQWTTLRDTIKPDTPDSVGSVHAPKLESLGDILSPKTPNVDAETELPGIKGAIQSLSTFSISGKRHSTRLEEARRELEEKRKKAAQAIKIREEQRRQEEEEKTRLRIQRQKERQAQRLEDNKVIKNVGPEWESKLQKILAIKNPAAITAPGSKNSGEISRRSMETLLPSDGALHGGPSGWLNDEVVNAYLESAVDHGLKKTGFKGEAGQTRKYHAFNTNMYNTYKSKGADGVKRWFNRPRIAGKNLLETEKVFIPVNEGSHWTLLVISGKARTISYYDSLGGKGDRYLTFGLDLVKATLGDAFKEKEWKMVGGILSARQTNMKDCGVFTCLNALALLADKTPMHAVQSDAIPMGRKMMAATLVDGGFGKDFDF